MITMEDCLAFCGLSDEEVLAIAEHEHIPEVAAAGLGQYLLQQAQGSERIRDMILEDISAAYAGGNSQHAKELAMVLRHFLETHPDVQDIPLPQAGVT